MSNDTAKVINLADRRAKKENEALNSPIIGWIIWLYCPKCKSLEYSEIEMPNGRVDHSFLFHADRATFHALLAIGHTSDSPVIQRHVSYFFDRLILSAHL